MAKKFDKVQMKYHGKAGYSNGMLGLALIFGQVFEVSAEVYAKLRADVGEGTFRAEFEILAPKAMRTVDVLFPAG
jgi:hypothetical protein